MRSIWARLSLNTLIVLAAAAVPATAENLGHGGNHSLGHAAAPQLAQTTAQTAAQTTAQTTAPAEAAPPVGLVPFFFPKRLNSQATP